jgi:hypothetical protein
MMYGFAVRKNVKDVFDAADEYDRDQAIDAL